MTRKETFRQQAIRLSEALDRCGDDLDEKLKARFIAKAFPSRPLVSAKRAYCSHCGRQVHLVGGETECPECHSKWAEPEQVTRASRYRDRAYLCVMTVMEGLQVMRWWCFDYWFNCGKPATYSMRGEVERQFINAEGERRGFTIGTRPFSYAYDDWRFFTKMTLRNIGTNGYYGYRVERRFDLPTAVTVIKTVIPRLRRNGLRTTMHGRWYPAGIAIGLLTNNTVEMLWKTGQYALASYAADRALGEETMRSINICNRNHYIVKDARMWLDHLDTLRELRLDTHNAHYVCPADLQAVHTEMTARLNRLRERRMAEQRAREAERRAKEFKEAIATYAKRWGKALMLSLSGDNLRVEPLHSVEEFAEEGKAMHHCVFSMGYYKSETSLIFSAKDGEGKRLATIEYDTRRGDIVQCRAACNAIPQRDQEIRSLINDNKKTIALALKPALKAAA